ncbi:hypothetical protein BGZ99_007073 [Dissophora globulifera]|uniref:Arm-like repeat domain-containing protein n=1 Tax=Dissophora globulifera TaxID=979702 RepID=A0A9P6RXG6_9FUNG|nr:hypothetical protein BGZ99_007073 [Dissophora globulifera]
MLAPSQSQTPPGNPQSRTDSSSPEIKKKSRFSFFSSKKTIRLSTGGQVDNAAMPGPILATGISTTTPTPMLAPIPVPTTTPVLSPPLTVQPNAIIPAIFPENIKKTVTFVMPGISQRFAKTAQLVHCARLLRIWESLSLSLSSSLAPSSLVSAGTLSVMDAIDGLELTKDDRQWIETIKDDQQEKRRIHQLVIGMVNEFISLPVKNSETIHEIVLLAPVLDKDHYRKLLNYFLGEFERATILDTNILQGVIQLVQDAPPFCLQADALTQILRSIRRRLEDSAQQDRGNTVHLTRAITTILVIMADCGVKDLDREQEHEPLVKILSRLRKDKDPFLNFQAEYAFQASLLVPDDETALMELRRHVLSLTSGLLTISGVIKLDFGGIPDGLPNVFEGARGLFDLLKESFGSGEQHPWYQAVRKAEKLVREGQLADLNKWICEAPCSLDPMFQWGVCQLLGEIVVEPYFDEITRKRSLKFLDQLYATSTHREVRNWTLTILGYISELKVTDPTNATVDDSIKSHASSMIQGLQKKDGDKALSFLDQLGRRLPLPCFSSILQKVNKTADLEPRLHQIQIEKKNQEPIIYIQLWSKANLQASSTDHLELLDEKVSNFLASQSEVLLILGDSGAGKSTFNLHLERKLWSEYQPGDPIPLLIDLKAMGKLDEVDFIQKKLEQHDFEALEIRELKNRQVILICDGYDECQQWTNLHHHLKVDLGWHSIKIVITCRTQYLPPVDYRMYFEPQLENNYTALPMSKLYEEAVIVPFKEDQIRMCIQQFRVTPKAISIFEDQPIWSTEDYLKQLTNLMDLVKNPFMLRIALLTLPRMAKDGRDLSKIQLTRFQLYDEFVKQKFTNELKRLSSHRSKMDPEESRAFGFVQVNFYVRCMTFSKRLAHSIFMKNGGVNAVEYSTLGEDQGWKDDFFGLEVDAKVRLLRMSSHLDNHSIPQPGTLDSTSIMYQFPHRSILEFLYCCRLCDHTPDSVDLDRYFGNTRHNNLSTCLAAAASPSLLTDHPLNQRSIVSEPSIIHFLADHVRQRDEFKDQLHAIIKLSIIDPDVSQAAANAITILVRAGIRFNGADLSGIRIPGADLSYGQFDSAQLRGADLRNTILCDIWLRQADLSNAQMEDVEFGEQPYLSVGRIVRFCAYSLDGKASVFGLYDGAISVYDNLTWTKTHTLNGQGFSAMCAAYSPSGHQIASGSDDKTVRLWDGQTGEPGSILSGHTDIVKCAAYSPSGQQIASGSDDKTVRLWDAQTGSPGPILSDHTGTVVSVVYSPNGRQIASCSSDNTVRLWDSQTGQPGPILSGHTGTVMSVVYSPNGQQIASGSDDKTVRLWDVQTGEPGPVLIGHTDTVFCIAYSPSGQQIASGSEDKTIRLWDAQTGAHGPILSGHIDTVMAVAYSLNGQQITSSSSSGMVRLWDVQTSAPSPILSGHTGAVLSVVHSPSGQQIASGSDDKMVRLWDVQTGTTGPILIGHTDTVFRVAYSPSGQQIASCSGDSTVRLWDAQTGKPGPVLRGHTDWVWSVVYSHSGQQIASTSGDKTVRLWDAQTGAAGPVLSGHTGVYSPNGQQIASCGFDGTVQLWDAQTGAPGHILNGHTGWVTSMVYSPNGRQIASGGSDYMVRLWDVQTGAPDPILSGHDDWITSVAYSPNSQQIASGSRDNTVRLWDPQTGTPGPILIGHTGWVRSVVYSPGGQQIASTSEDKTVWLWDVNSGHCLTVVSDFHGRITPITWNMTPNGTYFATGCEDKSVRMWQVVEEEGHHCVRLQWSSMHDRLIVSNTSLRGVQGLSGINMRLLEQRGAVSEPTPHLSSSEASKKLAGMASMASRL